ncbi:glyoxylate/hydroxypyruvate reductase A [Aquincola sp. S2]|uniref:Glyoxylate/hydroxypyruvate reductase A n=1 Tax=Pseudaquabacterium terrae TaxID=2732868 RepID=A0ABX2EDG4_9BURK|nr:glyoxylate/hydroxypyruvate reductase A [Aquabacterium terrae]NRF66253.1 glyoxylate/hydroxypyruvate reductase A [Aquabacterium terrae]
MNLLLAGTWDPGEEAAWAQALRAALPAHRLLLARDAVTPIDAAIVANPPPGSLQGLPALRLIQSLWAGVDRLLGDATLPDGVPVARMVDPAMNAAMAETALWAVLALQRDFFRYAAQQRERVWHVLPQRRADEVTVLVLGCGQMGRGAARRLQQQGYRVAAWSRNAVAAEPGVTLYYGRDGLDAALPQAHIVINLLPLTPETRGLLDASFFAAMPAGAGVVNLARGAHLVEAHLLAALASGRIAHAVLDVFAHEPLPPEHPFWRHEYITVLPHAAAQTDLRSAARIAADNIEALAAGRPLANLVDRTRGY